MYRKMWKVPEKKEKEEEYKGRVVLETEKSVISQKPHKPPHQPQPKTAPSTH